MKRYEKENEEEFLLHVFRIRVLCFLSTIAIRKQLAIAYLHLAVEKLDQVQNFAKKKMKVEMFFFSKKKENLQVELIVLVVLAENLNEVRQDLPK